MVFFRSLVLIICFSCLILLVTDLKARASPLNWQSADRIAPSQLMERVIQENFVPWAQERVVPTQMRVLLIEQPGQQTPLYIIDTRTDYNNPTNNLLCGSGGCNFLGYIQERDRPKRVFSVYLNPDLPPGIPLIEIGQSLSNGLPCLFFNQLEGEQIAKIQFCFDGQQYRSN